MEKNFCMKLYHRDGKIRNFKALKIDNLALNVSILLRSDVPYDQRLFGTPMAFIIDFKYDSLIIADNIDGQVQFHEK